MKQAVRAAIPNFIYFETPLFSMARILLSFLTIIAQKGIFSIPFDVFGAHQKRKLVRTNTNCRYS